MASIDRADWHYGNDFPENLPEENGGTHIGMYLNWIIDNNLISEFHLTESKNAIEKVKSGEMTGRDFLFDFCDGKFWNQELNEIGIEFTESYYSTDKYFGDYSKVLASSLDSIYEVKNSRQNYDMIKEILDKRFAKWNSRKKKKFWEFWK
ncbi:DUF7832 domain-containing protein [Winogradskyella haliclonae]|uniref:DUF7832 domain-containing protein n=1 Tax=Winogradskyella haliclonae TaxID=2048558 RepID=A0ABQ2BXS3_9FLAO|nr:hypothetical protein [Winogradskyella haliclonae]GGI56874.1 hypothetical protein GCM10011444_11830 [Winogradskyella haliclonae]